MNQSLTSPFLSLYLPPVPNKGLCPLFTKLHRKHHMKTNEGYFTESLRGFHKGLSYCLHLTPIGLKVVIAATYFIKLYFQVLSNIYGSYV